MEYLKSKVMKSSFGNDEQWKPFLRQMLIASSCWVVYFCLGMEFGSPTVIIPQLRRANITVSDEMASWLTSASSYASIPWVFILPTLARVFGRKKTSVFIFFTTIFSFVIYYFSNTFTLLLVTTIAFSITQAAVVSTNIITISEYSSPSYRGMFLCIKSATLFLGIWVANAIGTFTYWRYIPIVGFFISLHSLTVFFWPESPHWLASQNRFAECRRAHRWLKGTSDSAEKELQKLIESNSESADKISLKEFFRREFLLPLSLSMLAVLQYELSGKFVITIYYIDIMKKITTDESTVYSSMLILDGITVISTFVGCLITKFCKRRSILLVSCSCAVLFLLALSFYLYLVKLAVISENVYLSIFLLAGFSIAIACGPMIMSSSLYGELIPTRYKSITIILISLEFVFLHGSLLKLAPAIIDAFSLQGTILCYALSSGFCICLMYFYLPETKDRTLLEIEEYFRNKKTTEEGVELVQINNHSN